MSMLSLRLAARSATRLARMPARSMVVASRLPMMPAVRMLSVSAYSQNKAPLASADAELVAALKSEIKIEREADLAEPEVIKSFLDKSGYSVVATDGQEEVRLYRKDGSETINVYFSISDINNSESFAEDEAFEEEEEAAAEEEESAEDEFDELATSIRLNIVVEKPNGALSIEAIAQQDAILVESIVPYESAELATSDTPEADYKRRMQYQGPPYAVLDESVQASVEQYLESRGIDTEMAEFITEYASYRETNEYISWLGKVKAIVEQQ